MKTAAAGTSLNTYMLGPNQTFILPLVDRDETFPLKSGFPTFEAENWVLGFVQICNKNWGGG
jgi:hypothetical protein